MFKLSKSLVICLLLSNVTYASTKCYIVTEKDKTIQQEGNHCSEQYSPCSIFKIPLSLIGYNENIFHTEVSPTISFNKEKYGKVREVCEKSINPSEWMKNSCVWYSQEFTQKLGMEKFKNYMTKFNYGNQDLSGDKGKNNGLTNSWLSSSLKISPKEETLFIKKLINNQLPVSKKSHEITRNILFLENLNDNWKLYGKTGSGYVMNKDGSLNEELWTGWFVGWIEKDMRKIVFAHYAEDEEKIDSAGGIRAKEEATLKLNELIATIK